MFTHARLAVTALTALLSTALVIAACTSTSRDGTRFALTAADEACAACHADAKHDLLNSRRHGSRANALGCTACHLPHELDAQRRVVGGGLAATCESCHAEVVAQFQLPFRHTLGGNLTCTSCHSPHGGALHEEREKLREGSCVACHVEYRGPFVFRHEGDDRQKCMSCHEPHGASNRRLLNFADSNSSCFSCHAGIEGIHTQQPGSNFLHCLNCHTEVHGSNWSPELFR